MLHFPVVYSSSPSPSFGQSISNKPHLPQGNSLFLMRRYGYAGLSWACSAGADKSQSAKAMQTGIAANVTIFHLFISLTSSSTLAPDICLEGAPATVGGLRSCLAVVRRRLCMANTAVWPGFHLLFCVWQGALREGLYSEVCPSALFVLEVAKNCQIPAPSPGHPYWDGNLHQS